MLRAISRAIQGPRDRWADLLVVLYLGGLTATGAMGWTGYTDQPLLNGTEDLVWSGLLLGFGALGVVAVLLRAIAMEAVCVAVLGLATALHGIALWGDDAHQTGIRMLSSAIGMSLVAYYRARLRPGCETKMVRDVLGDAHE